MKLVKRYSPGYVVKEFFIHRDTRDNARVDFGRICQWGENRRAEEIGRREEKKRKRSCEKVVKRC